MTSGTLHLLFASRLVPEKGIDIVLSVLDTLLSGPHKNRFSITFCSDGEWLPKLLEIQEKYPDVIQYVGKVSSGELASLYRDADVLLMPSRFLETFGLTALESVACGTPVIGPKRGGISQFVDDRLELDMNSPETSLHDRLIQIMRGEIVLDTCMPSLEEYSEQIWHDRLEVLFGGTTSVSLLHDYHEKIGGAEYAVRAFLKALETSERKMSFFGYRGKTSVMKRRLLFMFSYISFWRYFQVRSFLKKNAPDAIWMHSILRYVGIWGVMAVRLYVKKHPLTRVFLSHHDVGLLAAYPQYITDEKQIPLSGKLTDFFPENISSVGRIKVMAKWIYVTSIKKVLPPCTHIVFAPFLSAYVHSQFLDDQIAVLPYSYSAEVFHP